jgi:DNA polymerase III subunit epsilon
MVAGHRIDEAAVNAFVDGAVITIAHNSGFDRKFAERYWPVFEGMAWAAARRRSTGADTASRVPSWATC